MQKLTFLLLTCSLLLAACATSQPAAPLSTTERTAATAAVTQLSADKWTWMAEKDIDRLADLFHDRSKFVHMSGTWNKQRELEIIESGSIWYKQADVHDVVVEVFGNTAIAWNRITLMAHVRGNDVSNEFTVTEIYQRTKGKWQLLDLTFSKVRDTHQIAAREDISG